MSDQVIVEKLKSRFSDEIVDVVEYRGETSVTVKKDRIVDICSFMKIECGYNQLCDLCSVDHMGQAPRFVVVYNLYNIATKQRIRIKALLEEADAAIDTVSGVWGCANWLERECWDMMGIVFHNHPDPRRILMPVDWQGHPLRKDYPVQGPDREPYKGRLS